ncbi:hypothetical protein FDECE_7943 [Fusarium decemcellulare]|nr:hypothetical protein FDECE_7943 [Fusarium decemcellulare]
MPLPDLILIARVPGAMAIMFQLHTSQRHPSPPPSPASGLKGGEEEEEEKSTGPDQVSESPSTHSPLRTARPDYPSPGDPIATPPSPSSIDSPKIPSPLTSATLARRQDPHQRDQLKEQRNKCQRNSHLPTANGSTVPSAPYRYDVGRPSTVSRASQAFAPRPALDLLDCCLPRHHLSTKVLAHLDAWWPSRDAIELADSILGSALPKRTGNFASVSDLDKPGRADSGPPPLQGPPSSQPAVSTGTTARKAGPSQYLIYRPHAAEAEAKKDSG